jgi:hypothetical protein
MRKGKYIDYTILLACLSKMPEPQKNKTEGTVDELINQAISKKTEEDQVVKILEPETV